MARRDPFDQYQAPASQWPPIVAGILVVVALIAVGWWLVDRANADPDTLTPVLSSEAEDPGAADDPQTALAAPTSTATSTTAASAEEAVTPPEPTPDPAIELGALDFSSVGLLQLGVGVIDLFDREVERGLGASNNRRPWTVVDGLWSVRSGGAVLTADAAGRSIVVVDIGASDAEVSVRLSRIAPKAGVVFRFVDRNNYWVILAAPNTPSWNVKKVVAGEIIDIASLGVVSAADNTTVAVRMTGATIDFAINGRLIHSVVDESHMQATQAGLTATGELAHDAVWADFVALPHLGNP